MMWRFFNAVLLLAVLVITGCDRKTDLQKKGSQWWTSGNRVSIAYLKSLYDAGRPVVVDRECYIEGILVSTDMEGNFYRTLILEDETGGIAVKADIADYFLMFREGKPVAINCNSLTLGSYGGMVQLGDRSADPAYQVGFISALSVPTVIVATDEDAFTDVVEPPLLTIGMIGRSHICRYVYIEDVGFAREEQGLTWSGNDEDNDRTLTDSRGATIAVRTSRHAAFASHVLPAGRGTIGGIVTYFNGAYQLMVNRSTDCNFTE